MAKRCSVDFVPGAAYHRMSFNAKQVLLCAAWVPTSARLPATISR